MTIFNWTIGIVGFYLFIGVLLAVNILRKTDVKTDVTQKATILLASMLAWGYFFVLGINRGMKSKETEGRERSPRRGDRRTDPKDGPAHN